VAGAEPHEGDGFDLYPGERWKVEPSANPQLRGTQQGFGCVALPANFVVRPVGVPLEAQKTVNEAQPQQKKHWGASVGTTMSRRG
jgi:hypothetical protein